LTTAISNASALGWVRTSATSHTSTIKLDTTTSLGGEKGNVPGRPSDAGGRHKVRMSYGWREGGRVRVYPTPQPSRRSGEREKTFDSPPRNGEEPGVGSRLTAPRSAVPGRGRASASGAAG